MALRLLYTSLNLFSGGNGKRKVLEHTKTYKNNLE